jgi:hypothetical protein
MIDEFFNGRNLIEELKNKLGEYYCGPTDDFPFDKDVVVAKIKADNEDGHDVVLECYQCPARFYTIKWNNHELSTGSGQTDWAIQTAILISEGMVDEN